MRQALTAFTAMTCLFVCALDSVQGQVGKGLPSVGFTNRTDMNVKVKGYTIVNNVQRSGPVLQIGKTNGKNFESGVPPGTRYYTIFDDNFKILLKDHPVQVQNRNVLLDIVVSPTDPKVIMIVPAQ